MTRRVKNVLPLATANHALLDSRSQIAMASNLFKLDDKANT